MASLGAVGKRIGVGLCDRLVDVGTGRLAFNHRESVAYPSSIRMPFAIR
jgi:hypothetical protein